MLDLTGQTFHRLTAISPTAERVDGKVVWKFKCSCGNQVHIPGKLVKSGNTKSCGCLQAEARLTNGKSNKAHGHAKSGSKPSSRTYNTWFSMKSRCRTKSDNTYYNYGAKGISYAPEWESFERFLADMGERPPGTSLDRIDGTKGYSKENCRWATPKEQVDNRSITRKFEFEGRLYTITDLANKFDIPRERVKYYLTEKLKSVSQMLEELSV